MHKFCTRVCKSLKILYFHFEYLCNKAIKLKTPARVYKMKCPKRPGLVYYSKAKNKGIPYTCSSERLKG